VCFGEKSRLFRESDQEEADRQSKMASMEGDRENLRRIKEGVAALLHDSRSQNHHPDSSTVPTVRQHLKNHRTTDPADFSSDIDFSWVNDLENGCDG